jgi:hypothetical protein
VAATQVVDGAGRVELGGVGGGGGVVGELGAGQDVEVVVGRVAAGVAFGADGGAEDDEVFGYACWRGGKEKEGRALVRDLFLLLFFILFCFFHRLVLFCWWTIFKDWTETEKRRMEKKREEAEKGMKSLPGQSSPPNRNFERKERKLKKTH